MPRRPPDRASLRLPPRAFARAAASRPSGRWRGWRATRPISSASPAISSPDPRGVPPCVQLLATLERPLVVLGNHDVAVTRDPFSRAAELDGIQEVASLLRDEAVVVELAGTRVQVVGVDATSYSRGTARPCGARRSGRRSPDPALPLPRDRADGSRPASSNSCWQGICTPARSSCRIPVARSTLAHPSARFRRGVVPGGGRNPARLAGDRDDVRPLPLLRPTRGDGARPAPAASGVQQSP